jgi:SsrA-binding protein
MKPTGIKLIAQNKKAFHDYHIEETFEAGLVLTGTEVKSLRQGKANLRDSYAVVRDGELYVIGVHISPYEHGNIFNHDPLRDRKLLAHKAEIRRLAGKIQRMGYTLVPTKLYFKAGKVKVEVGLARGKAQYDKRQTLAKRDADREIQRAFRQRQRDQGTS